jgi:hypothetical protein
LLVVNRKDARKQRASLSATVGTSCDRIGTCRKIPFVVITLTIIAKYGIGRNFLRSSLPDRSSYSKKDAVHTTKHSGTNVKFGSRSDARIHRIAVKSPFNILICLGIYQDKFVNSERRNDKSFGEFKTLALIIIVSSSRDCVGTRWQLPLKIIARSIISED